MLIYTDIYIYICVHVLGPIFEHPALWCGLDDGLLTAHTSKKTELAAEGSWPAPAQQEPVALVGRFMGVWSLGLRVWGLGFCVGLRLQGPHIACRQSETGQCSGSSILRHVHRRSNLARPCRCGQPVTLQSPVLNRIQPHTNPINPGCGRTVTGNNATEPWQRTTWNHD